VQVWVKFVVLGLQYKTLELWKVNDAACPVEKARIMMTNKAMANLGITLLNAVVKKVRNQRLCYKLGLGILLIGDDTKNYRLISWKIVFEVV
jgi:hypothetical protein